MHIDDRIAINEKAEVGNYTLLPLYLPGSLIHDSNINFRSFLTNSFHKISGYLTIKVKKLHLHQKLKDI